MKNIGILAVALVAALVLGFGARISNQTAHAQVTSTVVLGCEFLGASVDGDVNDVTAGGDFVAACDGLSEADINAISGNADGDATAGETGENGLGDNDGKLEASDLTDLDLDANQITNGAALLAFPANIVGSTYAIAFVNNDGAVTFDSQTGLTVAVNADGVAVAGPTDGNSETCGSAEGLDLDCDTATGSDGDGVVVATLSDGTAGVGTDVSVDISQSGGTISTETVSVVGVANTVVIASLKDPINTSGNAAAVVTCQNTSDISEGVSMLGDVNRTIVKATVTDNDDVELTRVAVGFTTSSATIATFDGIGASPDSGEPSSEVKSYTSISVASTTGGTGSFAVICGGTTTGVAEIKATINPLALNEDTDTVDVNVVGAPDNVALTASPAAIDCNGTATASVTATVTDSDGNNVADGTNVNFAVVALGTANPINVDTVAGAASSTITPLSVATAGVTVIVTSGDAQASILVACNTAAAATAVPGTPRAGTGTIGGPDTGNGGYLGQDSSAGFPLWTLVALALGSLALVGGGMVTRRAGK